eukprot:g2785.t1
MKRKSRRGVVVAIRTRPTVKFAQDEIVIDEDRKTIRINGRGGHSDVMNNRKNTWDFSFDEILHNKEQAEVYDMCVQPLVDDLLNGINGCVMAYGQTGAGKTFTMIGNTGNYRHRGICPRVITQLFQAIAERPDIDFKVSVSYMEIYNERIFDLIDDISNDAQQFDFQIVEDANGGKGTMVKGLTIEEVKSEEECLNLLFKGEIGRTTARHQLNKKSNRSHCIFTIYLEQRSRLQSAESIRHSKINLVDLAGSERLKKTMGDGKTAADKTTKRESMYINKSLTYLEQCVVALTSNKRDHIPYRQTKLTNVLKDSLGGNCRTVMIATMWAEARHLEETISTLSLASRMMRVKNKAKANITMDPAMLLRKYERQIKELKTELQMQDALNERSGAVYEDFTTEQRAELASKVDAYLAAKPGAEDGVFDIKSVKQITEIFRLMKAAYLELKKEGSRLTKGNVLGSTSVVVGENSDGATLANGGGGGGAAAEAPDGSGGVGDGNLSTDLQGGTELVGDLATGSGMAVGSAPMYSRPKEMEIPRGAGGTDFGGPATDLLSPRSPQGVRSPKSPMTGGVGDNAGFGQGSAAERNMSYQKYKRGEGAELQRTAVKCKETFRRLKEEAQALQATMAEYKSEMDRLKPLLLGKSKQRTLKTSEDEEVIDEEEFRLMKTDRDCKRKYRAIVGDFRVLKVKLADAKRAKNQAQQELVDAFEAWYMSQKASGDLSDEELLDYGEKFERLQMQKVMDDDPDSLAFFNANKAMRTTQRQNRTAYKHKLGKKRGV